MTATELDGQLELFDVGPQPLHSVPEGEGCFHCSYCRREFPVRLEDNHFYWTWNGRQYRTHDRCYAPALAAPELEGRYPL